MNTIILFLNILAWITASMLSLSILSIILDPVSRKLGTRELKPWVVPVWVISLTWIIASLLT